MRLIDADKYRDILCNWLETCYKNMLTGDYDIDAEVIASCIAELDEQPTVDIKHGHWISYKDTNFGYYMHRCSECRDVENRKRNYCPNCGVKMNLEENYDE